MKQVDQRKLSQSAEYWQLYVSTYPDLKHLSTEQAALQHYNVHGRREGRTLPPKIIGFYTIPPEIPASKPIFIEQMRLLDSSGLAARMSELVIIQAGSTPVDLSLIPL